MRNTTLCYIEQGRDYLMLHRVKKTVDENKDKWIGIGGKFEEGESPEDCLLREVREETGLTLKRWRYRGIVTFVSDQWGTEYMHLFTADAWEGRLRDDCDEGVLEWIDRGATVIVIEHDLDVIRAADYIVDMGPGGGKDGGEIVAAGTPEEIRNSPESITGRYL